MATKSQRSNPELQDGRTYHDFTFTDGMYASKAQTRRAIMAELYRCRLIAGLETSVARSRIADAALEDEQFLRSCTGQAVTAVARDVVTEFLRGRWNIPSQP